MGSTRLFGDSLNWAVWASLEENGKASVRSTLQYSWQELGKYKSKVIKFQFGESISRDATRGAVYHPNRKYVTPKY